MFDYPIVYTIIPVYDENNSDIYGYVACKSYLINEQKIDNEGDISNQYEVVHSINEKELNINSFDLLQQQVPLFENGVCINSNIVDNIYDTLDVAQEKGEEQSMLLFKKIAKDKFIPAPSYIRDLHDLKRAIETEISRLSDRLNDLNIIEKKINGQTKKM